MTLPIVAVLFVLMRPSSAQTDTNIPVQNTAPSPSGTGPTGATLGTVVDDVMVIAGTSMNVMHLGSAQQNQPGIRFITGSIQPAPGFPGGSLRWIQTCMPNRWREDNSRHWTHLTSDGPVLDKNNPSSSGTSGDGVCSPAVILDPNYQLQTVYDEYTTTLMYQPNLPNSIPVPIVSFSWYWTGVSKRIGAKWMLSHAGTSGSPHPDLRPRFPTWSGLLDTLSYR